MDCVAHIVVSHGFHVDEWEKAFRMDSSQKDVWCDYCSITECRFTSQTDAEGKPISSDMKCVLRADSDHVKSKAH